MSICYNFVEADNSQHIFVGGERSGVLYSSEIVPLSVISQLPGRRLGYVVSISHCDGQWLETATIVCADSDGGGTTLMLAY